MNSSNNYPNLFKPIKIGNMVLKNRIVHVPTDVSSSHADGSVSERDLHHHAEIAKGGVAMLIVGATSPDGKTGRPTVTGLVADADNYIPGLARLAKSIQRYGAKAVCQLQHPGRQAALPRHNYMSANDRVIKLPWSAGHEIVYENAAEKGKAVRAMSTEEVLEMIELFAEAAWRVKSAGFDGVEIHAAHGYLVSDFMSPYLNKRNDRFGGSYENRMRFPLAIIAKIQEKCGYDYPILVRYSVDEWVPGGRELEESIQVAKTFEEAGVAALDLSQCIQETPGAGFDPMQYPEGWTIYASEAIKKAVKIPVINSHSLRNPDFCEKIVAEDKTDLVGLSRQLLADPYWPLKVQYGKISDIRRCISCLEGCWQESMMAKKEIACAINPACGHAEFDDMKPAAKPLKIAIVGGGPAGMEAARRAAIVGHKVTLFEKTKELGGAILGCCMVPGKEKMKWYADWLRVQIAKLPIEVKMGTEPTVEDLRGFDAVANATGATSYVPEGVYGNTDKILAFEKVIACPKVNCEYHPDGRMPVKVGSSVIVWGDGYPAIDTATYLASIGKKVTIVTEKKEFGMGTEVIHMYVTRKRFQQTDAEALHSKPYKYPVTIIENSRIREITEKGALVEGKDFATQLVECDDVVTCHVRSNNEFFEKLRKAGVVSFNIGDSSIPDNLSHAVREGAEFVLNLDESMIVNANGAVVNHIPLEIKKMFS
ncbi:FAD-dependent oxidoreductase [Caproiciproducens galactitolivorans]|uniref:FAD-dependent oxidoreductase n=1 Tax=Caproiciproducens galactitolivorans TaxID=642589 RepID=A0ABT4BQF1_9FIRM|nr:FAD-dependent oxidoreductase [Caproiciproducens galactitolivorans]MCY1713120.1 FAD-dependent oxidoreductase [Caproiciproducens galactitolivorans]